MSTKAVEAIIAENQRQARLTMREHSERFGTSWTALDRAALWRVVEGLTESGYSLVLHSIAIMDGEPAEEI